MAKTRCGHHRLLQLRLHRGDVDRLLSEAEASESREQHAEGGGRWRNASFGRTRHGTGSTDAATATTYDRPTDASQSATAACSHSRAQPDGPAWISWAASYGYASRYATWHAWTLQSGNSSILFIIAFT